MGLQDSLMHIIWWHGDLGFVALSIISSFFILFQCYNYIKVRKGKRLLTLPVDLGASAAYFTKKKIHATNSSNRYSDWDDFMPIKMPLKKLVEKFLR